MIYGWISYAFMANMIANALWLVVFQTNTIWGFVVSTFLIFGILITNVYMMMVSTRMEANWVEWISLRVGMSIYAGWVTAATILNVTYMLKSWGLSAANISWLDEEITTIVIAWIAWTIYTLAAFLEKNPIYGGTFIWVITAIRSNAIKKGLSKLEINTDIITVLHSVLMAGWYVHLWTMQFYEIEVEEYWDMGTFYKSQLWFDQLPEEE